ncbi:MAG: hypothetical protein HY714_06725 [Candidatus Omnitrophica bacterium]|nr:hypothetical protein [Candidatus Omnitrophota bacterium]
MAGSSPRKKLGQILIDQGVLSQENLEKALEVQKKEPGLLGQILIRMELVKEEDIVIALATQFNYPYLAIQNFIVNAEAVKAVPATLAMKYSFLPIDKVNHILTVVMADPSNEDAIREIEAVSSCRVQAFVGTVSEIEESIRNYYQPSRMPESKPDDQKVKMSFKSSTPAKPDRGGA